MAFDVRVTQVTASVEVLIAPPAPTATKIPLPNSTSQITDVPKLEVCVVHVMVSVDVRSWPVSPAATHKPFPYATLRTVVVPKVVVLVVQVIASGDVSTAEPCAAAQSPFAYMILFALPGPPVRVSLEITGLDDSVSVEYRRCSVAEVLFL
jgi:hypothetical protein